MKNKIKLSVNVNKIATLRNSRGKNLPDVLQVSLDLIKFGAQGITVHPRPDERHIRREDVYILKENLVGENAVEFNIEGFPADDFLAMCCEVKPEQVTLVPDPPEALTSSAGFIVSRQAKLLESSIGRLKSAGTRVSVFVENNLAPQDFHFLKSIGCDRVELYTEDYAQSFSSAQQNKVAEVTKAYVNTSSMAQASGLGVNAGHDLNLKNLKHFKDQIAGLLEVSIGHALVCDALYLGFEETIKRYLACLN